MSSVKSLSECQALKGIQYLQIFFCTAFSSEVVNHFLLGRIWMAYDCFLND